MGSHDNDQFAIYLKEIGQVSLLTRTQERELGQRIQDGDREARDHMIQANLRLVVSIARGYSSYLIPFQDAVAEGNIGLIRATESYDPSFKTRFGTYATYWIKQTIQRAIHGNQRFIHIPAYMFDLINYWSRLREELIESKELPTDDNILQLAKQKKKKLTAKHLELIKNALKAQDIISDTAMDTPLSDAVLNRSSDYEEFIPYLSELEKYIGRLKDRKRFIITARFGLNGAEPKTLKEVGEILGITRERVRQLEAEALHQLHCWLDPNIAVY